MQTTIHTAHNKLHGSGWGGYKLSQGIGSEFIVFIQL